jgi:hypothetical protein
MDSPISASIAYFLAKSQSAKRVVILILVLNTIYLDIGTYYSCISSLGNSCHLWASYFFRLALQRQC